MNLIEYKAEGIKQYELDIWASGECSALAEIKLINGMVLFDSTGLYSPELLSRAGRNENLTERFCKILSCFRKIVEAEMQAAFYLIDDRSISLDIDKLWFDEKSAKLLPGHDDRLFVERLCGLALELNAPKLAERLQEESQKRCMSERDILRFLSNWELELK